MVHPSSNRSILVSVSVDLLSPLYEFVSVLTWLDPNSIRTKKWDDCYIALKDGSLYVSLVILVFMLVLTKIPTGLN